MTSPNAVQHPNGTETANFWPRFGVNVARFRCERREKNAGKTGPTLGGSR